MTGENMPRRQFLQTAAAATAFTVLPSAAVRSADANTKVKIGLIGCGGRGKWISNLVAPNAPAQITAVYDFFRDRVDACGEQLGVPANHRYVGMDGYKKMLETDVDAVMIISPPYYHPQQAADALAAGKHVYLAKPIAVDVPGVQMILDAQKKVAGKLNLLVDFQTRANEFYKGAFQKVLDGMIGKPVCAQAYYHAGRLNPQAPGNTPMARLRNWVLDQTLSGDIIVEQNIHVLDVANWFLRGHPVKAQGTGGRKARIEVGDTWDNYVVTYWYPDDVLLDFASTQFTYGFDDLCCRIFGNLGTVDSHYGGQVRIRAKTGGYAGGMTGDIYQSGAVNNIKAFVASIQEGKASSNIQDSAESTLTAILGRTATRQNRVVTWDEMMKANEKLEANLVLPADAVDWKP